MHKDKSFKKTGFHLVNLFGFEVRLDWTWIFLAILVAWTLAAGYFPSQNPHLSPQTYWIMGIIGAIGLFISIVLHELCHSLVGRHYGIPIAGITLFIFGGIAEMTENPSSPKAEFFMSLVGPLFSLFLGVFFGVLFQIGSHLNWPMQVNSVIGYLSMINFALGIFNLLPGFPLDGGRVLRAILWWWKGDLKWATQIAFRAGVGLGFAMIFFGILQFIFGAFITGLWIFLLGFFLQSIAKWSYQDLLIRETFHDETIKKYTKTNPITVPPNISIQNLVDNYFYKHYHKLYPVTENDKLVGYVSFNEIKAIPKEKWPELHVSEVMGKVTSDIVIDGKTPVTKVIQTMVSNRISRLIVTENEKLYGVITLKDLMDIISVKQSLAEDKLESKHK